MRSIAPLPYIHWNGAAVTDRAFLSIWGLSYRHITHKNMFLPLYHCKMFCASRKFRRKSHPKPKNECFVWERVCNSPLHFAKRWPLLCFSWSTTSRRVDVQECYFTCSHWNRGMTLLLAGLALQPCTALSYIGQRNWYTQTSCVFSICSKKLFWFRVGRAPPLRALQRKRIIVAMQCLPKPGETHFGAVLCNLTSSVHVSNERRPGFCASNSVRFAAFSTPTTAFQKLHHVHTLSPRICSEGGELVVGRTNKRFLLLLFLYNNCVKISSFFLVIARPQLESQHDNASCKCAFQSHRVAQVFTGWARNWPPPPNTHKLPAL